MPQACPLWNEPMLSCLLQRVLVVGASNSGDDISKEVAAVAHKVVVSARTWKPAQLQAGSDYLGPRRNIFRRGDFPFGSGNATLWQCIEAGLSSVCSAYMRHAYERM